MPRKRIEKGVCEIDPEEFDRVLSKAELRELQELNEIREASYRKLEADRIKDLERKKRKARKLEKEEREQARCFVRFAPCYDGPFLFQSAAKASHDPTVAPDYEGREDAMYDLACSYV